uniref:C-type lectin-like protein n=1 Tax=Rhabdophis tigrinus tigrinus TaxID=193080 RepID=D1MZV4_RHATT|nr:C-type lectin-like protein [Rhabdophis tigrinus tigrinus]
MGRFIFLSLGLLVVAFSVKGSGDDCPHHWSSYEKNCYIYYKEYRTWEDAENICMELQRGAHLLSIGSQEEEDFMLKLAPPKDMHSSVWLGLYDIWKGCSWEWSDGSRLGYQAWNETPQCAFLIIKPRPTDWTHKNCNSMKHFICEFSTEPEDPAPE